jgi:hypothetical protein
MLVRVASVAVIRNNHRLAFLWCAYHGW